VTGGTIGRVGARGAPIVRLRGEQWRCRRQRLECGGARFGALIGGDDVTVVGTVVRVHVRLAGGVIRYRRHEHAYGKRGHDEQQHDREASAGESGATHAQG
jgi:hypothetical protein